jgi:hypothetical protein
MHPILYDAVLAVSRVRWKFSLQIPIRVKGADVIVFVPLVLFTLLCSSGKGRLLRTKENKSATNDVGLRHAAIASHH